MRYARTHTPHLHVSAGNTVAAGRAGRSNGDRASAAVAGGAAGRRDDTIRPERPRHSGQAAPTFSGPRDGRWMASQSLQSDHRSYAACRPDAGGQSQGTGGLNGYITNLAECLGRHAPDRRIVIDPCHRLFRTGNRSMSKHDRRARPVYHPRTRLDRSRPGYRVRCPRRQPLERTGRPQNRPPAASHGVRAGQAHLPG
jgi:hypothetical protein